MQGDSLYTINSGWGVKSSYIAINYEECIDFYVGIYESFNSLTFHCKRVNLKTEEIIWEHKPETLKDLPKNTKVDSYTIEKTNNIWVYVVNYTLFDGTKGNVHISLNIDSGKSELK
jgi:hypothetical protein